MSFTFTINHDAFNHFTTLLVYTTYTYHTKAKLWANSDSAETYTILHALKYISYSLIIKLSPCSLFPNLFINSFCYLAYLLPESLTDGARIADRTTLDQTTFVVSINCRSVVSFCCYFFYFYQKEK